MDDITFPEIEKRNFEYSKFSQESDLSKAFECISH